MNTHQTTLLDGVDPEVGQRLITRRDAIRKGAATSSAIAAGLAMASAPVALAALSTDAFAQGAPVSVTDVLNFAFFIPTIP